NGFGSPDLRPICSMRVSTNFAFRFRLLVARSWIAFSYSPLTFSTRLAGSSSKGPPNPETLWSHTSRGLDLAREPLVAEAPPDERDAAVGIALEPVQDPDETDPVRLRDLGEV